jgi:hypothetical protein
MNEAKSSKPPRSAEAARDAETRESEQLGKSSFPASDPPAVWTWEVPKVKGPSPGVDPR